MKKNRNITCIGLMLCILFIATLYSEEKAEQSFLQKADEYFQNGKFSLAEIFYNKAVEEHPDNFDANYNLGKTYFFQKFYEKSIKYLQTAYDIKPANEIMFHIANCFASIGNPQKALSIYSNIIERDPGYADVYLNGGNIGLRQLYNKYITIAHWEKFLALKPNDPQAPNIRKALEYLRDPNFVLKPPPGEEQPGSPGAPGSQGTPGSQGMPGTTSGTNAEGISPILPEIMGKDLKSESEEKYNLKEKKTITTE